MININSVSDWFERKNGIINGGDPEPTPRDNRSGKRKPSLISETDWGGKKDGTNEQVILN